MATLNPAQYKGTITSKELPIGGIWDVPGSSVMRNTGDWKVDMPVLDKTKCISCLTCWAYCPDSCMEVKDGKLVDIHLDHCKGCGICASVCPPKCSAVTMKKAR
jgi:pyruvate ferredoxin oxidoreductase delta subunit